MHMVGRTTLKSIWLSVAHFGCLGQRTTTQFERCAYIIGLFNSVDLEEIRFYDPSLFPCLLW